LARLQLDVVDHGAERDLAERQRVPGADITPGTAHHHVTLLQAPRVQNVPLLPVDVVDQRDIRRPVRVVLDLGDPAGDPELVALEVDDTVEPLGTAPTTASRDPPMVVSAPALLQRLRQRTLRLRPGDLVE